MPCEKTGYQSLVISSYFVEIKARRSNTSIESNALLPLPYTMERFKNRLEDKKSCRLTDHLQSRLVLEGKSVAHLILKFVKS